MAYVCTLLDDYGNKTYPITVIDAIYDNNGIKLQSILDNFALASDFKNYAPKSHSHPEYQTTAGMTNYSTTSHKHEEYLTTSKASSDYASKIHSHNQYQTIADMSNYSTTSHTHSQYLTTANAKESYASKEHSHSQYITTADLGGYLTTSAASGDYAPKNHTHSEYLTTAKAASDYAPKSHSHSQYQTTAGMTGYSTTSHTHSQYLSTSGTAANSNKLGNVAASAYLTTASGKKFYEVSGTLAAGATSLSLSNGNITTASTIDVYSSVYGISPTKMTVSAGKVNMTFDAQTVAATIKVRAS